MHRVEDLSSKYLTEEIRSNKHKLACIPPVHCIHMSRIYTTQQPSSHEMKNLHKNYENYLPSDKTS